jgi:hypothetical protein
MNRTVTSVTKATIGLVTSRSASRREVESRGGEEERDRDEPEKGLAGNSTYYRRP